MGATINFGHTPILTEHLAQRLHDRYCTVHRPHRGFKDQVPHNECMFNDDHAWIREAGFTIAAMLPKMGELFDVIRKDERDKIAYHVRAELVCCDLYEQVNSARPEQFLMTDDAWDALGVESVANLLGLDFHDICHWGGYAAALAEQGPARDPRPSASACIVSGGTEPCKPNYFCPTVGEVESPCHGGFDVCCRRSELHREKK